MEDYIPKRVHIGKALDKQREIKKMSKTELGRRIGVRQQHMNNIFDNENIDTGKLAKLCEVLEFNFFTLYCDLKPNISAYLSALALGNGDANNNIGDAALTLELEMQKAKVKELTAQMDSLKRENITLSDRIQDKDKIIESKDELIQMYKNKK